MRLAELLGGHRHGPAGHRHGAASHRHSFGCSNGNGKRRCSNTNGHSHSWCRQDNHGDRKSRHSSGATGNRHRAAEDSHGHGWESAQSSANPCNQSSSSHTFSPQISASVCLRNRRRQPWNFVADSGASSCPTRRRRRRRSILSGEVQRRPL